MNNDSLALMMENAKGLLISAFNQVQEQTKMPAFLMEGAVLELLSEVRGMKNLELIAELNRKKQKEEKKEAEE